MAFDPQYREATLSPEDIATLTGPAVIEFGANWCGICGAFTPQAAQEFEPYPDLQHIRVEDGPGKRLGRSFRVKLWPTFVLVHNGQVIDQLVRPSPEQLRQGLRRLAHTAEGADRQAASG